MGPLGSDPATAARILEKLRGVAPIVVNAAPRFVGERSIDDLAGSAETLLAAAGQAQSFEKLRGCPGC
jgi:hypothetical protein